MWRRCARHRCRRRMDSGADRRKRCNYSWRWQVDFWLSVSINWSEQKKTELNSVSENSLIVFFSNLKLFSTRYFTFTCWIQYRYTFGFFVYILIDLLDVAMDSSNATGLKEPERHSARLRDNRQREVRTSLSFLSIAVRALFLFFFFLFFFGQSVKVVKRATYV